MNRPGEVGGNAEFTKRIMIHPVSHDNPETPGCQRLVDPQSTRVSALFRELTFVSVNDVSITMICTGCPHFLQPGLGAGAQLHCRMQRIPSKGRSSERTLCIFSGRENLQPLGSGQACCFGNCQGSMTCRLRLRSFNCPPVGPTTCSGRWDGMCEN